MKIGIIGTATIHPVSFTNILRGYGLAEASVLWGEPEDAERTEKFSQSLGLPVMNSPAEVLKKSDAVFIITRANRHRQYAVQALESGKPAFLDKQMAVTYADARAIVEAAERTGTPVMAGSIRRFSPAFVSIADKVRSGEAGRPLSAVRMEPHGVKAGDWQDLPETSGGLIVNFGIHCVDTLQYILGRADTVFCFAGKSIYPDVASYDTAVITIRFAGGAVGIAEVIGGQKMGENSATAPHLRVICEKAAMEAKLTEDQALLYNGRRLGVSPYYEVETGTLDMMKAFVEMVQTGKPAIPYDDMLEVMKILEAAVISAAQGRPVKIQEIKK